jgi:hypothetical protein
VWHRAAFRILTGRFPGVVIRHVGAEDDARTAGLEASADLASEARVSLLRSARRYGRAAASR